MRKILALSLLVFSSFTLAHTGSHTSDLIIELNKAEFTHKKADITLTLSNRGYKTLVLERIKSNVGVVQTSIRLPLKIKADSQVFFSNKRSLQVTNKLGLPQIFTLVLDFGEAGSGPFTIVPTSFME